MQFRYKLAKETFKNKKIPPKKAPGEDNISADQRGNDASIDGKLLSLDKDTKLDRSEPAKPATSREVSRRDLFSFGRLTDFAEAVEEGEQALPKKKKAQAPEEETSETKSAEAPVETAESEAAAAEAAPKKNFFRRMIGKFKAEPEDEIESTSAAPGEETSLTDEAEANAGAEAAAGHTASPEPAAPNPFELSEDEEVDPEYSRRNLLRQGVHFFAKPAVEKVQSKIDRVNETVDKITKRVPLIRPPGAISERKFLQACTRCDECIHACPKDAIQRAPKKMGFLIAGTPYIDPKKIPCVMCDDLPCIPACPDGALVMPESRSREDVKMGYAILDKAKCQAYGDTFCQQCVIDCPIPGAISQVDQKPVIHKNACTGCGVCVLSCSTVNIPLAIKIKPQMVIESQLRKKRLEQEKARLAAEREAEEKAAQEAQAQEPAESAGE